MKKLCIALTAGLLCLLLAGCGGGKAEPFEPEKTTRALLDAPGVFSEELVRLDGPVVELLYGLEGYDVREAVCWYSPGGTAEEVAVFRFADEAAAKAFVEAARAHIEDQKEANESYRPLETPKLDKALVEQRAESVLVLVADDYAAAEKTLG